MGLLDIVGSFAGAGANILSRQNRADEELEQRKAQADYQAEIELKKQETIERLKAERAKREQGELVAADDKAREYAKGAATDRAMPQFKRDAEVAGMTDENGNPYSEEDLRKMMPEQKQTRTQSAQDYVDGARKTGNTGLLSQAKQSMDVSMRQDEADARTAREERRQEEAERRNRETERQRDEQNAIRDRQVTAAIAKSSGGSSGGSGRTDPTYRLALTTQLNAANKDVTELRKTLDAFDSDMLNKTSKDPAVIQKRQALTQELADAVATKQTLLEQFKTLGENHSGATSTKPSSSKPAGGQSVIKSLPEGARQIGTSNGKPVYQTPDGKKFIAK